jgi:hypothetical protein
MKLYRITVYMATVLFFCYGNAWAQTAKVKTVPAELSIGNLKGHQLPVDSFKAQKELRLDKGLRVKSYTAYFSGANFQNVIVASVAGESLTILSKYTDRLMAGSVVSFDNIRAISKTGEEIAVTGKSFILYAGNMVADSVAVFRNANKELAELMEKNFISGTVYFSGNGFPNVLVVRRNEFLTLKNIFSRCVPGSIVSFENCIFKNADGTLSKPVTQSLKLI